MDANIQSIHRMLADKERKLLVLAKAVYALLNYASAPLDLEQISELRYKLNEAFGFEL
jgi:hypothetical protein